jgi:hypothetical protein
MRVCLGNAGRRHLLSIAAALVLATGGCSLDKVEDPPLVGPSETGLSVQLTALPDTLNADGVSQAVVQMVLRDPSGQPVSGRAILFCTTTPAASNPLTVPPTITVPDCEPTGSGFLVAGVGSTYVGPVQSGLVMATDKNGVANVVWVAGTERTRIFIGVRPYGIDAAEGFLRTVEIFQQ